MRRSAVASNHNDQQKIDELECVQHWLTFYNRINKTGYCCLKANYFQNEVDVYAYRIEESGRPLRLQVTKAEFDSLAAAVKHKKKIYSPEQKADLFLLLDFQDEMSADKIDRWQAKHLDLLSGSGFLEIWLVGPGDLVINLWPGLV